MDEKHHLTWGNAGATIRNVSRLIPAVFVLMRPGSGPSAKGREAVTHGNDHVHIGSKIRAGRHHLGVTCLGDVQETPEGFSDDFAGGGLIGFGACPRWRLSARGQSERVQRWPEPTRSTIAHDAWAPDVVAVKPGPRTSASPASNFT
jgi:hypothetical protein